jgi:hypothetical protein
LGAGGRHPADRTGRLHRAPVNAADQLRRAPPGAVGADELVGVQRRAAAQRGLREVPRRWAHAQPRRGTRAGDERAHRRLHPAAAALRPDAPRRQRGPRAQRADERRMDHPVGHAPAQPGRGPPPRRRGRRDRVLGPAESRA